MVDAVKAMMRVPMTRIGIVTAVLFQLIFAVVWMTGYEGVNGRIGQLKVALVNEDAGLGAAIGNMMMEQLPFKISSADNIEAAKLALHEREVQMVVHIPSDFSATIAEPGSSAALRFYINESNPVMIKNIMSSAAQQITNTVNEIAARDGTLAADKIGAVYEYSNPVKDMSVQMVPMMMVLASYVGAMLLAMNLEQSSAALASQFSGWQRFAARQLINTVTAVIVGCFGVSLVSIFGGTGEVGFIPLWGFQTLFLFAFMCMAQVFLLLFGSGGMVFNILFLSVQLVSSGAMVPRELLSEFYIRVGDVLPSTYAVEGLMNLLFGGPSAANAAVGLTVAICVCLTLSIAAVGMRELMPHVRQRRAVAE